MRRAFILVTMLAAVLAAAPGAFAHNDAGDLKIEVKSTGGDFTSLDVALDFWADGNEPTKDNDRCIYTGSGQNPAVDHSYNPAAANCPDDGDPNIPVGHTHTDWTLYSGELSIELDDFEDVQAAIADWQNGFHENWDSADGSRVITIYGKSDLTLGYYDDTKYHIFHDWSGTGLSLLSKDKSVEVHDIQVLVARPENNDNVVGIMSFGRSGYDTGDTGGHWYLHHAYLGLYLEDLQSTGIDRNGLGVSGSYGAPTSTYHTRVENVLVATTANSRYGKIGVGIGTKKFKMYNVTVAGSWDYGFQFIGFDTNTSKFQNNLVGPDIVTESFNVPYGCTNWSSAVDYIATASDSSFPCTTSNGQICGTGNELVFVNDNYNWSLHTDDVCATDHGECLYSTFTDDTDHDTRPQCGGNNPNWDIGMDEKD